jgi:hypothetical protein
MMTEFNFERHYSELLTQEIGAASAAGDMDRLSLIGRRCLESAAMTMAILADGNEATADTMVKNAAMFLARQTDFFRVHGGKALRPNKAA